MNSIRISWLSISHLIVAVLGIFTGVYYTVKNPGTLMETNVVMRDIFYHDILLVILTKLIVLGIVSFFAVIASFYLFRGYQYFSLGIGLSTMVIVMTSQPMMNPLLFSSFFVLGIFQLMVTCSNFINRK